MLALEEEGRRFLIWSRTTGDTEAAKAAGMNRISWIQWRLRRKLPSRGDRTIEFIAVWRKAKSDPEAAKMLNEKEHIFANWRKNHNLPPCLGNPNVRLAHGRLLNKPIDPIVRHGVCANCGKQTSFYVGQDRIKTCGREECIRARKSAGGKVKRMRNLTKKAT